MNRSGEPQDTTPLRKAVAFFSQAGLSRILELLREKYIELGRVGGQVLLHDSTPAERREIASLLGKSPSPDSTLKIRLMDVDKALKHSGFACTLPELLHAFFPELITRPEKRAAHMVHQNNFRSALQTIVASLPAEARARPWLEQGTHGLEWLFARYKNATQKEQEHQLAIIRYITSIIDQLPGPDVPQRLALFAQRTSGDPHMLDPDRPAGRLLLLALNDLSSPTSSTLQLDRPQQLRLYSRVGLLTDTISSFVAVCNLQCATYHDGTLDPWIQSAGERVLLLPLRQLLAWNTVQPRSTNIYVIENPQVFEEVADSLQDTQSRPTLICTAGWPSVAALTLLDLLLASIPDDRCYYSGDFDLKGLQIAAYLQGRYQNHFYPWHFDSAAYLTALQSDGVHAPAQELEQLNSLPAVFTPLVASIQDKKKWAYQEGITHLLLASILSGK